ncbi:MAG: UDP-N-acetylmuramate dehydrogenase, partial [Candidatus Paceibacterota bacterium]
KMIDELGLKGYRVGGAVVSDKHANFITNKGGATADDVKKLVKHVKAKVKAKYGKKLEEEVVLI